MLTLSVLLCLALILGGLLAILSDLSIGRAIRQFRIMRRDPARVAPQFRPNPYSTPILGPNPPFDGARDGPSLRGPGDPRAW